MGDHRGIDGVDQPELGEEQEQRHRNRDGWGHARRQEEEEQVFLAGKVAPHEHIGRRRPDRDAERRRRHRDDQRGDDQRPLFLAYEDGGIVGKRPG